MAETASANKTSVSGGMYWLLDFLVMCETTLRVVINYSVIQKDGLNFVSLYFKIRTSDKYDMA